MADALYMDDSYLKQFQATIKTVGDNYIELDRTAFYPKGGGQPGDKGEIDAGPVQVPVAKVRKSHGDIRHFVVTTEPFDEGMTVEGIIDWERRYDHMRMHTAQHLVSAIVLKEWGATTAGNQIHREQSRIDFKPFTATEEKIAKLENMCNSRINEDPDVRTYHEDRETVEEAVRPGRTNLDLIPDHIDPLRVVAIGDFDICPCGGTHVSNLDELNSISIVETENKGAETERIVFELG